MIEYRHSMKIRWILQLVTSMVLALTTASCDTWFGALDGLVGKPDAGSTLVGCDQAVKRIVLSASVHLDPTCTYTRGFDIIRSGVTLDCRGASVERGAGETDKYGILVTSPADFALSNIEVRNCNVTGFSNNLRVRRQDFKELAQGHEYDAAFSNIVVRNSVFTGSGGSGVFVDGYVTGVTLSHITVKGSGSVGIYLEAGSKGNLIENSVVTDNGFGSILPGGATFQYSGITIYYQHTGREGIAVDGSRDNVIRENLIMGNAAGGIFLYKNCGEDASTSGHWVRRYGAGGNVIQRNWIASEPDGVWVGSRAAENQFFMDCSDMPYVDQLLNRVYLDPAKGNTLTQNMFIDVTNGVRIEDDDTTVTGNWFFRDVRGVLIGTKLRTTVLGRPVSGTVIAGNSAYGTIDAYSWVWGEQGTVFSGNAVDGTEASLTAGTQPTINPFLFVVRLLNGW
jgi:parallel beta-helix repeat protein